MKRQRVQYSKDEIITNLYTIGLEYMFPKTYESYAGPYHMYTTGEVFTEFEWKPNISKKLIKYQNINTPQFLYKQLKPQLKTTYDSIQSYIPYPSDEDLKRGMFKRYFMMKYNEKLIFEIDVVTNDKFLASEYDPNMYTTTTIDWHLSGIPHTKQTDGITTLGVYEKNKNSVVIAENKLPGISLKITNYLEFYTGDISDIVVPKDING